MQRISKLTVFVLMTLILAYPVSAEEKFLPLKPMPEISDIKPVPDIKDIKTPEIKDTNSAEIKSSLPEIKEIKSVSELKEKKEVSFHGVSMLERLDGNEIVLNDCLYNLVPDIKFYSKEGKAISRSNFREGDTVGFILNLHNPYQVVSLWKIK